MTMFEFFNQDAIRGSDYVVFYVYYSHIRDVINDAIDLRGKAPSKRQLRSQAAKRRLVGLWNRLRVRFSNPFFFPAGALSHESDATSHRRFGISARVLPPRLSGGMSQNPPKWPLGMGLAAASNLWPVAYHMSTLDP